MAKTVAQLVMKYGTAGRAAGAVALQIETLTSQDFMELPEVFRSLVLFKQQTVMLTLAGKAAGCTLETLQRVWRETEQEEQRGIDG